jgi:hypothetical protein
MAPGEDMKPTDVVPGTIQKGMSPGMAKPAFGLACEILLSRPASGGAHGAC